MECSVHDITPSLDKSFLASIRGIPIVRYDQLVVAHVEIVVTCVWAARAKVAVVGGDDATETRVAEIVGLRAICDRMVPGRTVNAPRHHQATHGV